MENKSFIDEFQSCICNNFKFIKNIILNSKKAVATVSVYTAIFSLVLYVIDNILLSVVEYFEINKIIENIDIISKHANHILWLQIIFSLIIISVVMNRIRKLKEKKNNLNEEKKYIIIHSAIVFSLIINAIINIITHSQNISIIIIHILMSCPFLRNLFAHIYKIGLPRKERRKLKYNDFFFVFIFLYFVCFLIDFIILRLVDLPNWLTYDLGTMDIKTIVSSLITGGLSFFDYKILKCTKINEETFCGKTLDEIYQDLSSIFFSSEIFKTTLFCCFILEGIMVVFGVVLPVTYIIFLCLLIIYIGLNKDKCQKLGLPDEIKLQFKKNVQSEVEEIKQKGKLDYHETYFEGVLSYNMTYVSNDNGSYDRDDTMAKEIMNGYEDVIRCIIPDTLDKEKEMFLASWKYIDYSLKRFIQLQDSHYIYNIDGDTAKKRNIIKLQNSKLCKDTAEVIKTFLEYVEDNELIKYFLVGTVISIYGKTVNIEYILVLADKISKKYKSQLLYSLLIFYLYRTKTKSVDYLEDDYSLEINNIFSKKNKIYRDEGIENAYIMMGGFLDQAIGIGKNTEIGIATLISEFTSLAYIDEEKYKSIFEQTVLGVND